MMKRTKKLPKKNARYTTILEKTQGYWIIADEEDFSGPLVLLYNPLTGADFGVLLTKFSETFREVQSR